MLEKFNVVSAYSGIPINRRYFYDRMDACAFILRMEAEDRRLGIFEPGSYMVEMVVEGDSDDVFI